MADAMSRLPTTNKDQSEPSTDVQGLSSKVLASMEMFALEEEETFPLDLSLVQKTQNIELNRRKSQLKQLVRDTASKYNILELDGFSLVAYEGKYMSLLPLGNVP